MSMYNMMHGVNPATVFLIPMLGDKHPDEYPRFRDVFIKDPDHPEYDDHIHVYTRVGGGNRFQGYGEDWLYGHPDFVTTFDDSYDNTYGSYVFRVPDRWKADYELVKNLNILEISDALKAQIDKVFPKLKGKLPWHEAA